MRGLGKYIWLLVGGFLLFAPPGTLIIIAALITGWLGGAAAGVAAGLAIATCSAIWLVVRARRRRKRRMSDDAGLRP